MDEKQLLAKLNWFYSLELNQVDLYNSQSKTFKNSHQYASIVFERVASIEQQHVENIADKIRQIGGTPSKLGDVLFPIMGKFAGTVLSLSGLENTLKANIFIEHKAMEDYSNLIKDVDKYFQDDELLKILKSNYVDEDLHSALFSKEVSNL